MHVKRLSFKHDITRDSSPSPNRVNLREMEMRGFRGPKTAFFVK